MNAVSLQHLFMQVVLKALEDSRTSSSDPPDQEAAFYRIEQLGYQVGQRLSERILLTQTPESRILEQIDGVKFLCKEFWGLLFGKSIDNLKTNHRGVYVLHDHTFAWIARFGIDANNSMTAKMAVLVQLHHSSSGGSLFTDSICSTWHSPAACCVVHCPAWALLPR